MNAIAPSLIATPMSRRAQEDPAILRYLASKQPLAGGPIDADAVTATALHLLSPEAAMVTGQVVAVDGGWGVSEPTDARRLTAVPLRRGAATRGGTRPSPTGGPMRQARRPAVLVVLAALVALLAMPAVALAADPVTVTGTVVRDGAPVVGVEVVVSVTGTDVIASTATDEQGAFSRRGGGRRRRRARGRSRRARRRGPGRTTRAASARRPRSATRRR